MVIDPYLNMLKSGVDPSADADMDDETESMEGLEPPQAASSRFVDDAAASCSDEDSD